MCRFTLQITVVVAFLLLPVIAFAAGGHDGLACAGCHSLHKAKTRKFILSVEPNTKDVNPRTQQPYSGSTAICLACHQTPEKGGHGMTAISGQTSHPYDLTSINPRVARVPSELLRNGRFECSSCHDPHPSNTIPKYLRIDTRGGASMEAFCAACHPMKSDPKTASVKGKVFSSMDEQGAGQATGGKSGKKK